MASGLPDWLHAGVLDLARRSWRAADDAADRAGLTPEPLDDPALCRRLDHELTAPLRLEDWPAPTTPRAVAGGWIHDEVVDEDRDAFESLLPAWAEGGPERVAEAAQELRWAVTPYRPPSIHRLAGRPADRPDGDEPTAEHGRRRPAGHSPGSARGRPPKVVDLTSHWAGPLATALLAGAGAEVVKVDPDARPDGFRPRAALYRHLNGAKRIVSLDLRHTGDRARFEELVAGADLLVESFSRRVLPNLGYDRAGLAAINPRLDQLSIRAFPAHSPEASWLAYGPGVHAASGIGLIDGEPRPAAVAYPDLVAGVAAYARAVALLADGVPGGRAEEVSLAGAIAPLAAGPGTWPGRGADHG